MKIIPGGNQQPEPKSIDETIETIKQNLKTKEELIDPLYYGIGLEMYTPQSQVRTLISQTIKTSYQIEDIDTMILKCYVHDTEGEFKTEEFFPVNYAIAEGLERYYQHRIRELNLDLKIKSSKMIDLFYQAITSAYPDVNDFIYEYNTFKKWSETDENDCKQKTFSFWVDHLFDYGANQLYLKKLLSAKEIIGNIKRDPNLDLKTIREIESLIPN